MKFANWPVAWCMKLFDLLTEQLGQAYSFIGALIFLDRSTFFYEFYYVIFNVLHTFLSSSTPSPRVFFYLKTISLLINKSSPTTIKASMCINKWLFAHLNFVIGHVKMQDINKLGLTVRFNGFEFSLCKNKQTCIIRRMVSYSSAQSSTHLTF